MIFQSRKLVFTVVRNSTPIPLLKLESLLELAFHPKIFIPPISYTEASLNILHKLENKISTLICRCIRKYKKQSLTKVIDELKSKIDANGHNVFKLLRNSKATQIACLFTDDNEVLTEDSEIGSALSHKWVEIFSKKQSHSLSYHNFLKFLPKPPFNAPKPQPDFSPAHIRHIIHNKAPTSPSVSKITWTMLKHLPEHSISYLSTLFTKCFDTGEFPESWKLGRTALLNKPNTPPSAEGFRPSPSYV